MATFQNQTPKDTIDLLEARLKRIQYVITGVNNDAAPKPGAPAIVMLQELEHGLNQLVTKSKVLQDLLKLHARRPNFFHHDEPSEPLTSEEIVSRQATVLASASLYQQAASRLVSINDAPIPTAESSAKLIDLEGRLAQLQLAQDNQAHEIAALKQRSAAALQRWYSVDILQAGDYWAELEERVEEVEKHVRRASTMKDKNHSKG